MTKRKEEEEEEEEEEKGEEEGECPPPKGIAPSQKWKSRSFSGQKKMWVFFASLRSYHINTLPRKESVNNFYLFLLPL